MGHKVAVVLGNGAGMVATLDEVRDDGVVLSEMSELGPGPTMFCPWDSLRRLRDRPVRYLIPWRTRLGVVRRSPGSGRTKSRARTTMRTRLAVTLTNARKKVTR